MFTQTDTKKITHRKSGKEMSSNSGGGSWDHAKEIVTGKKE